MRCFGWPGKRPAANGGRHSADGVGKRWSMKKAEELQSAIDAIFARDGGQLAGLAFSFTISDPRFEDCPLIGCSTGFATLCGYTMEDIVGRNCRFLVDPVPPELVSHKVRRASREFCNAVRDGRVYNMPEGDREPWMPPGRHSDDGIFCIQMNARKDGSLFRNMFYLKMIELNELPYVVALQTEVSGSGGISVDLCQAACRLLDRNMNEVERALAKMFWVSTPMRRQEDEDANDGFYM